MKHKIFLGKVAVITGSSRGIGKAIALELAEKGASIVLNGRDRTRLQNAEMELKKVQSNLISICCDVSTIEGGQHLIDETIQKFGRIDFLINNVGVSMRGNFADLNPEVFRSILDSNVLSVVYPSIPAIQHLRKTNGSIIFISSLAGIRGLPLISAYCSAKMALRSIAESIRIEEAKNDLHVGLIYVGYTEIENGKETISADGSKIILVPREGKGAESIKSVAQAVVINIIKRKFITVLTTIGKLNYQLQAVFPKLVEWIILRNLKKFKYHNR